MLALLLASSKALKKPNAAKEVEFFKNTRLKSIKLTVSDLPLHLQQSMEGAVLAASTPKSTSSSSAAVAPADDNSNLT